MYNGKQSEQQLKSGGRSASLDKTNKLQRVKCIPKTSVIKTGPNILNFG